MHLSLTHLLLALAPLSATTLAAPAPSSSKSMMVANTQWTLTSLKRVCNNPDTNCTWSFGITTGSNSTATDCTYVVEGNPASKANGGPATCGHYIISSGWSGQFGPEDGFTTLSVIDEETRRIVWPAYTDKQLEGGQVVRPDQSYTPSFLP
ncbi:hypothetical protein BJX64DRAFT_246919 [Aspergillus heterothallicus]